MHTFTTPGSSSFTLLDPGWSAPNKTVEYLVVADGGAGGGGEVPEGEGAVAVQEDRDVVGLAADAGDVGGNGGSGVVIIKYNID